MQRELIGTVCLNGFLCWNKAERERESLIGNSTSVFPHVCVVNLWTYLFCCNLCARVVERDHMRGMSPIPHQNTAPYAYLVRCMSIQDGNKVGGIKVHRNELITSESSELLQRVLRSTSCVFDLWNFSIQIKVILLQNKDCRQL